MTVTSATLGSDGKTITIVTAGGTGTISPGSPTGFTVYVGGHNGVDPITSSTMNTANGTETIVCTNPIDSTAKVAIKYDFAAVSGTQIQDSTSTPNYLYFLDNFPVTNSSTITKNLTLSSPTITSAGNVLTASVVGSTGTINLASTFSTNVNPYGFRIVIGSGATAYVLPVLSASISTTTLTLNLQSVVPTGLTATLQYYNTGPAQIWDSASPANSLANFSPVAVTNSSSVTANIFLDNLTGTTGDNWTAHTPDVGSSPTLSAGTESWTLTNASQTGTSTTKFVHNKTFPGSASNIMTLPLPTNNNYKVSYELYNKTKANAAVTLWGRANTTNTIGYSIAYNPNGTGTITVNKSGGSFRSGTVTTYSLASISTAAAATTTMAVGFADGFTNDSRGGASIVGYTVTGAGSGYTTTPTITVNNAGTGGQGAAGTVTRSGNTVASVAVKDGNSYGDGYQFPFPTLTVTGGSGTGATVTPIMGQGRPCTIITIYVGAGSGATLGAPVLTIVDDYIPLQSTNNINWTAVNDGVSNGTWLSKVRVDYDMTGSTPITPQYQWQHSWSDGSYPYTTFNETIATLPALGGVPPYTYKLYRNTSLSVSGATLVNNLGASPSSLYYTDTPNYSTSPYYYYFTVQDALSNVAQAYEQPLGGSQWTQFVQAWRGAPLNIFFIGDSITTSGSFTNQVLNVLMRAGYPKTVNGLSEGVGTGPTLTTASYVNGQSGSSTNSWLPGAFLTAAETSINTLHCTVVSMQLGANDARDGQTTGSYIIPTTYGANLTTICNHIFANCSTVQKIVLQKPFYSIPGGNANGNIWTTDSMSRYLDYGAQIDSLDNGSTIFAGTSTIYNFMQNNPSFFIDGVHPNNSIPNGSLRGDNWMAVGWAQDLYKAIYAPSTGVVATLKTSIRRGISN